MAHTLDVILSQVTLYSLEQPVLAQFLYLIGKKQGHIISLTGLIASVSLKQLKIEFYWLMLPAEIGIYMFTKAINLLVKEFW